MSNVGRNDPCPCGSGKKYKKCCIGKYESGMRAETDTQPGIVPHVGTRGFESYPDEDWGDDVDDADAWQEEEEDDLRDEIVMHQDAGKALPVYADPPEETLPTLPPGQNRLVKKWWKTVKPLFKKGDADAMLRHLTGFWDLHPGLIPHLELEMEFLFELGADLGRQKEWPRYADLLLRLREEHPEAYLRSFGYFDYYLIIEALVQGNTRDILRFFDIFHRYPGSDGDNAERIARLLAWAGAEEALLEFVKPLRKKPHDCGVSLDVNWLLFGLQIPHLSAGADPDEAADSVMKELKKLNLEQAPSWDPARLSKEFDCARQAPTLPDYASCHTRAEVAFFLDDVTWNFMGFLHRFKGLPWTRACFLADRLRYYWSWRAENARPMAPFSLDLTDYEGFLCRTCMNFTCYDGVLAASGIEAMARFADYLLACGALGEQEHLELQDACRTLHQQALTTYGSTDPVPRLMPELVL